MVHHSVHVNLLILYKYYTSILCLFVFFFADVGDHHGEQSACCMILARVLLGNSVITKVRNGDLRSATSTPCKICLKVDCVHDSSNKFDSLIFDGGLFREYVIYENQLVYPEYVIYYDRI